MASVLTTEKQLAQRLLTTTDAQVIYTVPNRQTTAKINLMVVANVTAASRTYSVWVNQGGTATGDGFALYKTTAIATSVTDSRSYSNTPIILNGDGQHSNASIMAQGSAANAITVTLYGSEVVEV